MTPSRVRQQRWLSVRGAHAALLGLSKALPEIWRNPQKLTILLPKTERRLDETGVVVIRWSDKGGEAYVPYVSAGRHHAYKQSGSQQHGKPVLRVALTPCLLTGYFTGTPFCTWGSRTKALFLQGCACWRKLLLVTSAVLGSGAKGQIFQHRTLLSLILLYGQIDCFYSEICCCPVNI